MAAETQNTIETIVGGIKAITNPTITTVIEFDTNSSIMLGTVLLMVLVLAIIAWAIARKMTNPA